MKRNILVCSLLAVAGGAVAAQLTSGENSTPPTQDLFPPAMIEDMIRVVEADRTDVNNRLRLAGMLEAMGRAREAAYWYDQAAAIDPEAVKPPKNDGQHLPIGGEYPRSGPDVIVGSLVELERYGRVGNITAYSVGTTSCNAGDTQLSWVSGNNQHPVIAQHMYRVKDGRFEQIGQSWVKHGFFALQQSLCTSQFGYGCQPAQFNALGVGCSDPYTGSLNGSYTYLGPKHEINPSTGAFSYPHGSYPNNGPIGKRIQVHDDYVKPSLNAGAIYFVEGQYVAPDDAAAGNGHNNASYRRIRFTETSTNVFTPSFVSGHGTVRELPAIFGWKDVDPTVEITSVEVFGDGVYNLGYKVTDNGNGTWTYEFALHNLSSDRSGQSFNVPVPSGVNITNVGFHDVAWHSGAPYSNDPWDVTIGGDKITWSTELFSTNHNANALRWGTVYNFRFDADTPPAAATVNMDLFKPGSLGTPNKVIFAAVGPTQPKPSTPGDLNGDGIVNVGDLLILLGQWGTCPKCDGDLNGDGEVNVGDMLILLGNWG